MFRCNKFWIYILLLKSFGKSTRNSDSGDAVKTSSIQKNVKFYSYFLSLFSLINSVIYDFHENKLLISSIYDIEYHYDNEPQIKMWYLILQLKSYIFHSDDALEN